MYTTLHHAYDVIYNHLIKKILYSSTIYYALLLLFDRTAYTLVFPRVVFEVSGVSWIHIILKISYAVSGFVVTMMPALRTPVIRTLNKSTESFVFYSIDYFANIRKPNSGY